MSTHSKVDLSTLGWVKTEIDETLKQARLALESFAENPSDKTRLRFCITHLHQVVGTLLMVELDGAAMLAKETEALADDVINDKVTPDSRALDALTRGRSKSFGSTIELRTLVKILKSRATRMS